MTSLDLEESMSDIEWRSGPHTLTRRLAICECTKDGKLVPWGMVWELSTWRAADDSFTREIFASREAAIAHAGGTPCVPN